MSAMYAVMKMFYSRQDSYISCMQELQRAQATQHRMRGHVRRHRRAAKEAQGETDNAITALEARWVQLVNVVLERDVARAELRDVHAKRDDVIRLAKTREVARIRTVF